MTLSRPKRDPFYQKVRGRAYRRADISLDEVLPRFHEGGRHADLISDWSARIDDLRVRRVVCAVDCGRIVNPDIVRAQIESGVVYGISGALWGEVTLKNGRVEQSNSHNYRVLRMNETPPIEVHLVRNSEAPGGIGEPGTAVTAPALGNAIFAATGKRRRKLPLQSGLALVAR
jgi:isoquinoline 1-oxidoreductase beta subunit